MRCDDHACADDNHARWSIISWWLVVK